MSKQQANCEYLVDIYQPSNKSNYKYFLTMNKINYKICFINFWRFLLLSRGIESNIALHILSAIMQYHTAVRSNCHI